MREFVIEPLPDAGSIQPVTGGFYDDYIFFNQGLKLLKYKLGQTHYVNLYELDKRVVSMKFSSTGNIALELEGGEVRLCNDQMQRIDEIGKNLKDDSYMTYELSNNGKFFAAYSESGKVVVKNVESNESYTIPTSRQPNAIAIDSDRQNIIITDGGQVLVHSLKNGQTLSVSTPDIAYSMSLSDDCSLLAIGHLSGISLWDSSSWSKLFYENHATAIEDIEVNNKKGVIHFLDDRYRVRYKKIPKYSNLPDKEWLVTSIACRYAQTWSSTEQRAVKLSHQEWLKAWQRLKKQSRKHGRSELEQPFADQVSK